jgi:nucleoid-associated protein YgaU
MLEKATLTWFCLVPPIPPSEATKIKCQFNPEQLTISKEVSWDGDKSPNFNAPILHYAGGEPATYSLSLFFDGYDEVKDSKGAVTSVVARDVRKYTNALLRLTLRGAGNAMFLLPYAMPPLVNFEWGKIKLFTAVVEKVEITFTMFDMDGTPIRAKADVSFKQQDPLDDLIGAQNPTSRTDARKTRRVYSGQRLDQIAFEEYGDARYWRLLAEANGMDDPFQMVDGQLLVIPQEKP